MKGSWVLLLLIAVGACKSKKGNANEQGDFFPVVSFLKGQAAMIDSSMASFTKIETTSTRSDTTAISRAAAKALAQEFLSTPDITSPKWHDDYTETEGYDTLLQQVIFNYTPTEKDAPVQAQTVLVQPGPAGGEDEVKTIIIDRLVGEEGRTVRKNLLWQVGRSFQVVTMQPDGTAKTVRVQWNK